MRSSMARSISSRTLSLNFLNVLWSTLVLNSLLTGSTWRMFMRLTIRPSSRTFLRKSRSMEYVDFVSPSRPQIMLIPGSSLGIPLSPLSLPTSLIVLTASRTCSEVLFRLFSRTTLGSTDSIPSARTLPSVQFLAMLSSTLRDSSG